ncbi:hypothetical protein CDD80_2948 [Ophiocordyceps camponoti-rufipedis]|uniref:Uncharacterized protein n=1 Tax=Ophiocordyceps camponoti-rufipedis TaxID=2004952 RepID=A0A2C5Z461_9HYPO|nr:hypothetical protein CDD80_2948 [Ophiocordyceps camponoti-rufipedis]
MPHLRTNWTSPATSGSAQRYVAGSVSSVANGMKVTDNGVFSLGSDGVLRSFDADRSVVDYRQLDPDQAKDLATKQMRAWESSGKAVPASLAAVVESSVDGRLVTDVEQLMNPAEKPAKAEGQVEASVSSKVRRSAEELFARAGPKVCPGQPGCQSLADCQRHHCNACYFPHGPPHGTCFL